MSLNFKKLSTMKFKFMFITLLVIGFINLTLIYSFNIGSRMVSDYVPLLKASKEIRIQTTTAHLWSEELIMGDEEKNIEEVEKNINKALMHAEFMLDSSVSISLRNVLFETELVDDIRFILKKLHTFKAITDERFIHNDVAGVGSDLDREYDKIFVEFIELATSIEQRLTVFIEKDYKSYQRSFYIIAIAFSFIILVTSFLLYRFELEKKKRELFLIEQSRFASMGEMIGNIAHQWRQPLNTLGLISQKIHAYHSRGILDADTIEKNTKKSMELIESMSETINDFRDFFKPNKDKEIFSVLTVMDKLDNIFLESLQKDSIKCKCHISEDANFMVKGYMNEFSQVMINLVKNAGDVLLEAKRDNKEINITVENRNSMVIISVKDNGGGIPTEIKDKIFDPYFTTRDDNKGTGIGLYMSKIIINEHMDGNLTVHNTDEGACFVIELHNHQ